MNSEELIVNSEEYKCYAFDVGAGLAFGKSEELIVNSEEYKCYAFDVGAGLAFGKSEELIVNSEEYKCYAFDVGADALKSAQNKNKPNANTVGAAWYAAQGRKSPHGITLIALIITIIIMLILAGVVLNLSIGEHGIFKTAQEAGKKYDKASSKEKLETVLVGLQADKITDPSYNEQEYLENRIEQNDMHINGNIVTVGGWQFEIDRTVPELVKEIGEEISKEDEITNKIEKVVEYGQDMPIYKYLDRSVDTKFIYNGIEVKNTKELPVGEWKVRYNKETNTAVIDNIEKDYIEDLSGLNHNLYLKNGTSIKKDEQGNNYLSFDGQDDYARINELEETIDWTNGFTIEFEATWEAFNGFSRILDFGNGEASDNIIVGNLSTTNQLLYQMLNGYSQEVLDFSTSAIILNEKAKYAIKYEKGESNNNKVTFYKNGEEIFSKETNYTVNNILRVSNYLGKSNWPDGYFNGKIYSLKITEADGTNFLWYDIDRYVKRTEPQYIKVVGDNYTGRIADISGKGHELNQINGLKVKIDENSKYYLSFDGQDDYARINELEETIDWANGFTIEFEATWEAFNGFSRILDFGNGEASDNIIVGNLSTTNQLLYQMLNGYSQEVLDFSTSAIILNEEAKYTIKYEKGESNNNKVTFYKNGEEIFSKETNYTVNNILRTSNYLGKSNWTNGYFNGKIYSLKITEADGTPILWYDINKWIEISK